MYQPKVREIQSKATAVDGFGNIKEAVRWVGNARLVRPWRSRRVATAVKSRPPT
ncbi:MAG: hypothetical protein RMX96_23335 [Nostoc sp. ChiSLP02]|nr:hypothetical protein [Nostoc sp. DedSLP05]MDZ8103322.1 hypothetical protein [Nostoc sp. DedSLP01]MDZ8187770.1 hypothetical protein [Nostoc sp. ChiSLP02]